MTTLFGRFSLYSNNLLDAACRKHLHDGGVTSFEQLHDFILNFLIVFSRFANLDERRQVQVVFCCAVCQQQADLTTVWISVEQLVLSVLHEGDAQVVGSWTQILILFASKNIKSHNVSLRVTMF